RPKKVSAAEWSSASSSPNAPDQARAASLRVEFCLQRQAIHAVLQKAYDLTMAQVYMSEAEIARDFASVLAKVRAGTEIIVEDGYRRIASIKPVEEPGR